MMQITSSQAGFPAVFDRDEMELCIILLDLKNMIRQFEFRSRCKSLVGWGRKRQRSRRVAPVTSRAVVNSPSPPSPIHPPRNASPGDNEIQTAQLKVKIQAASSPATPLSFSPSESDEKRKRSSRKRAKTTKKSREEWLRSIEELKHSRETLTRELENVMIYYNSLKAYNLKLKAMKEEELLRTSQEGEEPKMEMTRRSVTSFGPSNLAQYNRKEQQPVAFEMRTGSGMCQMEQRQLSYGLGLTSDRVGPVGIPDLNLPAEQISGDTADSPQTYDLQRLWADPKARYAEARRNRKIKNSMKIRKASGLTSRK